jgi:pyruvate,water dikinase
MVLPDTLTEIPGVLLVDAPTTSVRGTCNHTSRPVDGTVLVVETLSPDLYDAIVASAAVICARGGRTGHMQSLCRSRGIPVLRVEPYALTSLVGEVTVRLDRPSVMLGDAQPEPPRAEAPTGTLDDIDSICVVVADDTDIRSTNALNPRVDQVTSYFIREEFLCLAAGLSPIDALRAGPAEAERYGAAVAAQLNAMTAELLPGQRLVMRLLDLRSDDAARITTGAVDNEPNPELGLHGARWLVDETNYPHAFQAIRANVNTSRLSFAVPFINDRDEFLRLRKHLDLDRPVHDLKHGTNQTPREVPKTQGESVRKGHSHGDGTPPDHNVPPRGRQRGHVGPLDHGDNVRLDDNVPVDHNVPVNHDAPLDDDLPPDHGVSLNHGTPLDDNAPLNHGTPLDDNAPLNHGTPLDDNAPLNHNAQVGDSVPLGVFVETPAAVHSAVEFCAAGASELFVGTKDLIQFYLAADRGNHRVASVYQTRHPAVLNALRQAVEAGRNAGVPVHVFALGADVDHYVRNLPTRTLMMCTAELQHLSRQSRGT